MFISGEASIQGESYLLIRLAESDFPKEEHLTDALKAVLPEGYSGSSDDLNLASFFKDQGETEHMATLKNVFDNKYAIPKKTVEDSQGQWRGVVQLARYQNCELKNKSVVRGETWYVVPPSDKVDNKFYEQFFFFNKYVENSILHPEERLAELTRFTKMDTLDAGANYCLAMLSLVVQKSSYPIDESFLDFTTPHLPSLETMESIFDLPLEVQSSTATTFLTRYYSLFPDTEYEFFEMQGYNYEAVISAYLLMGSTDLGTIITLLETFPREYILRMGNARVNL